jgi:hypothetical protein
MSYGPPQIIRGWQEGGTDFSLWLEFDILGEILALFCTIPVGQAIVFCGLFPKPCRPRNLMKNEQGVRIGQAKRMKTR